MAKKILTGKTSLSELYTILNYETEEALNKHKARLFPVGNTEQEVPTASIFLASLSAVKEFREELFTAIKVSKIKTRNVAVHVYTEINSKTKEDRPDGLIVITSGKTTPVIEWAAFVEFKVKDNFITQEQIDRYIQFASEIGIDNIITISNYLTSTPLESPVSKGRKKSFNLYHWSWTYIKVTAKRLITTKSIEDEDHIYILEELRRYFDSHKNLKNFTNMGKSWKESVNRIHDYEKSQKIEDDLMFNIIDSYRQEEKDISFQLTDRSRHLVELVMKKDHEENLKNQLTDTKVLQSNYIVNGDKSLTFTIEVDFIRQKVTCLMKVSIDKGKSQAQTTALLKKYTESGYTEDIYINAYYVRNKSNKLDVTLYDLLEQQRKQEQYNIIDKSFGDEVKFFEMKTSDLLGAKFQGTQSFIDVLESIALRFLKQVIEPVM